ncbi:NAD-glutamate dehydrogenase [Ruania halotolerans]|uniref:NAD-glutamate dehydrogenase n=1 Tax=Ruania halotolerans TaxID=2897773 RepID=UPI001E4BC2B1|nr:NAD-glutamate dehydrogenase [Ruania halotolerans]UFU06880.1 NAD-glutamate dehydrogenase [Ruania halotolerans]
MDSMKLSDRLPDRDQVMARIIETAGEGDTWLVERLLEHVATEDLAERSPAEAVGIVRAMRALAERRAPKQTLVQVSAPEGTTTAWSAAHTLVQVCTDDMPFLVDSVTAALSTGGHLVDLVVHPTVAVRRDESGTLTQVREERPPTTAGTVESWMLFAVERMSEQRRAELTERLEGVLRDVRNAVSDWAAMRLRCEEIAREMQAGAPPTVDPADVEPTENFLTWLARDHFTFLGYREYELQERDGEDVLSPIEGTGLGILHDAPEGPGIYARLRPEARISARTPRLLTITKANSRATVHRPVYLDYIGVRTFDPDGNVTGERRILGMFTSAAYAESVLRLPIVAEKVRGVLERSGFSSHSHSGKDLLQILEAYPRDELFQSDADQLWEVAEQVMHLEQRRRAKLFLRRDEFGRFVSVLVYLPRDRYNTTVRLRLAELLRESFGAEQVDFTTRVSDSPLAQLHAVVRMPRGVSIPDVTEAELQPPLIAATRTWEEDLLDALHGQDHEEQVVAFVRGFPEAYKEDVDAAGAVADLAQLVSVEGNQTRVRLYEPGPDSPVHRRIKVYRAQPIVLTDILPAFTDLGVDVVDERPYRITDDGGTVRYVYDFGLRVHEGSEWPEGTELARGFEDAFLAVRDGRSESDSLGALVLRAGLSWRQVIILRTIARYVRQVGSTFSVEYLEDALVANPRTAASLVALFEARFDPDRYPGDQGEEREQAQLQILAEIDAALEQITSLDYDRIVRTFTGVIRATLRTNYYLTDEDGGAREQVSLKLECRSVPGIPAPVPMAEIWVYSPRVEGVHLRFGYVARGGLRWSDRREDFRTEVLGLVKAQMVKNAVIVPTGSKGGFVAKRLPDPAVDRDAWLAEGQAAYRLFIHGMLDITDNRETGSVRPPDQVVRHDGDDPYLVVAADKGTATFSDIANGISAEHDFWLDDAFASGGSAGYDHKAMGITARGAWESTKRHFAEMGRNSQAEDFTCVGIGDMSGDVFGNGMLLSEHIRLVAAFDHRHVFLDPSPDAAASYAERRRLFDLPRSTWADYDSAWISEGGGVYPRTAKSIEITPQVREALGLGEEITSLTPAELIRSALLAPVDLLFNGGIGTYIKASSESHNEIGDRANDAIRVDGSELRCEVFVEGGNLGASQLGRIEAATHGVRINTDAIDNSAGVATSDREVNIKILLTALVKEGVLDLDSRNELLASMTEEVAAQVLRDNYVQNVLLGNSRDQAHAMLTVHQRLIHWLEERGELDRTLEFLPSDTEIAERDAAGTGLTRPEFAVLVAYAKLALKADLATTDLPDGAWFSRTLSAYFPEPLRARYGDAINEHPLRREIIVNDVVNSMVNRGGITFAFRATDETGATSEQVARAFVACREIFDLESYVAEVEQLDLQVPTDVQTRMYIDFRRLLDRSSRWMVLRRPDAVDVAEEVDRFAAPVQSLMGRLPQLMSGPAQRRCADLAAELVEAGVGEDLAARTSTLLPALALLDVVEIANETGEDLEAVAALYFALSARFHVSALLDRIAALPLDDRWGALARAAVRDDLTGALRDLTRTVQKTTPAEESPERRVQVWAGQAGAALDRAEQALPEVAGLRGAGLAPLSVAVRALRSLVQA